MESCVIASLRSCSPAAAGCSGIPTIEKKTVGKMGLKGGQLLQQPIAELVWYSFSQLQHEQHCTLLQVATFGCCCGMLGCRCRWAEYRGWRHDLGWRRRQQRGWRRRTQGRGWRPRRWRRQGWRRRWRQGWRRWRRRRPWRQRFLLRMSQGPWHQTPSCQQGKPPCSQPLAIAWVIAVRPCI